MSASARSLALILACALAACGDEDAQRRPGNAGVEPLPQPEQASGAVTSMPTRPGPGEVPLGGEPPPPAPLFAADERFGMPLLEDNPETGLGEAGAVADGSATGAGAAEPTPADAAAVLRQYYAAIAAGDHARAHGLWSDGGAASGQTLDQFGAQFAQVAAIEAHVGDPGAVGAAAGSRYVEIPVMLRITRVDGSRFSQAGRVVLRRAVVDGASAEQRAWRIASADVRDAATDAN